MKKIAAAFAFAVALALTATASARPQHHQRAATGSTVDSGYYAPRSWSDIEVSVPSGGF